MATRLEKSRPTRRPIAKATSGGYVRPANRFPLADKKGFPANDGRPVPVTVGVAEPAFPPPEAPNDDLNFAGTRYADASLPTGGYGIYFVFPALVIGRFGDANNVLPTLGNGDRIFLSSATGSNLLTLDSLVSVSSDTVEFVVATEDPTGVLDDVVEAWL